jgi:very-short-patch-repair endonuclease
MDYKKKLFGRVLRKDSTPYEKKVWELLRDRRFMNLKFRRQHVIEGFIVDFYCHQLRLAVEIDGSIHNRQQDYDDLRQRLIESEGIRFIRFTNDEIDTDIEILGKKIRDVVMG